MTNSAKDFFEKTEKVLDDNYQDCTFTSDKFIDYRSRCIEENQAKLKSTKLLE